MWGRTNDEFIFNEKKVSKKLIDEAEVLLDKCRREDKDRNLVLSRKAKQSHKTMVNLDSGYVRGYVVDINVFPEKEDLFKLTQAEFADVASKIFKRRNNASYESFEEFKEDLKKVVFVESVFESKDQAGEFFFACSCFFMRTESGVKGKTCAHVVACLMDVGKIKRTSNKGISNFSQKRGAAKKNMKQNS